MTEENKDITYEISDDIGGYSDARAIYKENKYELSISPYSWASDDAPGKLLVIVGRKRLRELVSNLLRMLVSVLRYEENSEDVESVFRPIDVDLGYDATISAQYVSRMRRELRLGPLVFSLPESQFEAVKRAINDVVVPRLYVEDGEIAITRYWAATEYVTVTVEDLLDGDCEYDEDKEAWIFEGTENEFEEIMRQAAQGIEGEPEDKDMLEDWDMQDHELDDVPEVTEAMAEGDQVADDDSDLGEVIV